MKILDPGHHFSLDCLDGGEAELRFVKRVGDHYPGNAPPAHGGPTTQEVLRALISRTKYVDSQIPSPWNQSAIDAMRVALMNFEHRAAIERSEGQEFLALIQNHVEIEDMPTCSRCGHIGCLRHQSAT